MLLGPEQLRQLARLAGLSPAATAVPGLLDDLDKIVRLIGEIQDVDIKNTPPLTHPLDLLQPLRADEITANVDRKLLQRSAPEVRDGHYLVPRVVD